jgi:hypothetical protein
VLFSLFISLGNVSAKAPLYDSIVRTSSESQRNSFPFSMGEITMAGIQDWNACYMS